MLAFNKWDSEIEVTVQLIAGLLFRASARLGLVGLISTAKSGADGIVSCKSCSHFFPASKVSAVVPVMLAPGRFKLPT